MKTEIIKIPAFTEKNIMSLADDIISDIESGNTKPLPAYIQAKALESLAKEIIKRVKDQATEEASLYGADDSCFNGAYFTITNSGNTLDYDFDDQYNRLNAALKARRQLLSDSYKAYNVSGQVMVDSNTGELVPLVPVKKESEQIIKVSFKEK